MRARSAVAATVVGLGVLAAAWRAGQHQAAATGTGAAPTSPPPETGTAAPAPGVRRVDGSVVSTPYGDVQVRAVLRHGVLTDVTAVHLTDHGSRSVEISAHAAPILRSEARAARSAHIDTVSGASYTSDGYRRSLQYALDHRGTG